MREGSYAKACDQGLYLFERFNAPEEKVPTVVSLHKLRGATAQSHLFRVGTEGEGQDAFYFDWGAIEDGGFEDPLAPRLNSRASNRERPAEGFSPKNKPNY